MSLDLYPSRFGVRIPTRDGPRTRTTSRRRPPVSLGFLQDMSRRLSLDGFESYEQRESNALFERSRATGARHRLLGDLSRPGHFFWTVGAFASVREKYGAQVFNRNHKTHLQDGGRKQN